MSNVLRQLTRVGVAEISEGTMSPFTIIV